MIMGAVAALVLLTLVLCGVVIEPFVNAVSRMFGRYD